MPELPEVETTLRGIKPHIEGEKIKKIIVRQPRLRWPVPKQLNEKLSSQKIQRLERRAKYLLFHFTKGTLVIHLGMSGRLQILSLEIQAKKHDHVDIELTNQKILRLTDPRRFGAVLWIEKEIQEHSLFKKLGPEPLSKNFSEKYLWPQIQNKSVAVKSFIMNQQVVVGVGNIYAAEALFLAKIHPATPAKNLTPQDCRRLITAIKTILRRAIRKGGTTLKDFLNSAGKPGYFVQQLQV